MTTVAIVGSGPSAIYALQGLLKSAYPIQVTLFEAGDIAGVGTPYDPRTNPIEMLANIASIEIPPVGITLLEYLTRCPADRLAEIGVDPGDLSERAFFPRVALGSYLRDRLSALAEGASERGHAVVVLTRTRVVDVIPADVGADVRYLGRGRSMSAQRFDKVILATGHTVPSARNGAQAPALPSAAPNARAIGVFGSSLSAIDLAVSLAFARGSFADGAYALNSGQPPFVITMMSRGGRLPEADFFCPLPARPIDGFAAEDVEAAMEQAEPGSLLEAVFAHFAKTLGLADPEYGRRIGLETLSVDTFADAYFAERDAQEPFAWARRNLEESRRNHRARHVVPWRYAILQCHEAFGLCVDKLDENELKRFAGGMKRVFADNYAAVPPLSVERLLALHDVGVLKVVKLDGDYDLETDEATGNSTVTSDGTAMSFDVVFDARGQAAALEGEFPFPSLRMLLMANRDLDLDRGGGAIRIDANYQLADGINPLRNVWCLSLPFLLDRKPFIQGLTSASDMGKASAEAILSDMPEMTSQPAPTLASLIDVVAATETVMLPKGAIVLAPKAPRANMMA